MITAENEPHERCQISQNLALYSIPAHDTHLSASKSCRYLLHYCLAEVAYLQGLTRIIQFFTQFVKKYILLQSIAIMLFTKNPVIQCVNFFTNSHKRKARCEAALHSLKLLTLQIKHLH